jgi:uncharacterized protein with LGFP repeats
VVLGAVHGAWVAGGGTAGVGVPVAAEEPAGADGRRQRFDRAGGAVYWSPSTGAYHVLGGVRGAWEATGGADGVMGFPVSAEHDTPGYAGGRQSRFQRGTAVWSPRYGAHVVLGAVHGAWAAGGGTAGVGVPVSAEEAAGSGGRKQAFSTAGGVIYWSSTTGAHRVLGAIRTRYDSLGGPTSRLGYPTTEEYPVPGGRATRFEHGTLTWSSSTGKVTAAYVAG